MYKGGIYLAVGDSTTVWKPTKGNVPYPAKIAKLIADNYGRIQQINVGFPGTTTQDWMKRNNMLMGRNVEPDLVTICFGINDSYSGNAGGWGVVPTATFQANIEAMVDHYKRMNPNVHIILCSSPTVGAGATPSNASVDPYRTAMATAATNKGVDLCPFETGWTTAEVGNYVDGDLLHPNDAGHQKLSDLLWPIVQTKYWINTLG